MPIFPFQPTAQGIPLRKEVQMRSRAERSASRLLLPVRAALARQGCSCPSGLGRPGTVFWLPRSPSPLLVRHDASWAGSWYHHPGVNELFHKRWHNSTHSSLIRGWHLSLTNTSHRRELTAGAGLVQRQQLCLHKPLFSPRAAVHLIAASWGSVGHFKPSAAAV